jgi:lipopolysaccharide/colanic/teichoic acid biosynthesis glycosyltransferase
VGEAARLGGHAGLEIQQNLLDPLARITKRSFDLAFALATAPLWGPLCAGLGLLIWLEDRRSPLFRQERMGLRRRPFTAWKFRTMHPDAEALLQQRLAEDDGLRAEWAANFKLRRDPRITPIGRLLRRTSLDELPQMINVLRGEMSLVGPRPLPPYHFDELPERVKSLRDRVRPGLTGLWQVSGRSEAGQAGMARWDTYYVRNWSFWLDIIIFFRTARAVLTGHGAFDAPARLVAAGPAGPWGGAALGPHEVMLLVNRHSETSVEVAATTPACAASRRSTSCTWMCRKARWASRRRSAGPTSSAPSRSRWPRRCASAAWPTISLAWAYAPDFPVRITGAARGSRCRAPPCEGVAPEPAAVQAGRYHAPLYAGPDRPGVPSRKATAWSSLPPQLQERMPTPSMLLGVAGARGLTAARSWTT